MPYVKGKVKPYKNTTNRGGASKPAEKKKPMAKKKPMKK